jgi:hypothetical protein
MPMKLSTTLGHPSRAMVEVSQVYAYIPQHSPSGIQWSWRGRNETSLGARMRVGCNTCAGVVPEGRVLAQMARVEAKRQCIIHLD